MAIGSWDSTWEIPQLAMAVYLANPLDQLWMSGNDHFIGNYSQKHHNHLLGGLEHEFYFLCHIWDVILPIDFHSSMFQDGHIAPPTSRYYY